MNSKCCSLDPIPTWLVKSCFEELKCTLLHIINKSLLVENTFPATLKHSIITPSIKYKDGDSEDYNNYRPISNTTFLGKMLEKIALVQINCHIEKYNLHAQQQSGYRKNHSCETAMVKIIDDIYKIISEGDLVAVVLLDLSAAFDTVDHKILVDRLQTDFGITGNVLRWITSYLNDRTFSVIRKHYSHRSKLCFGVPQGSLLGPILFIMYTKETTKIAERHGLQIHVYADDTQLYIGFKRGNDDNERITADQIHACLHEIKYWMTTNYLKINPGKTKFIVIGSPYTMRNNPDCTIKLFNESDRKELEKLSTVLTLGVNIDSTISMKAFVNAKCSEAYYKLRNIGRLRSYIDTPVRIMLVRNLILSKLDYCNAILANVPDYLVKKLQKVLNASVRFIYDVRKHEHISAFLQKAHFLPVKQRIQYKLCILVFKIVNGVAPAYLSDMVSLFTPARRLRVGRDDQMVKSNYSKSIAGKMAEVWNMLPREIRSDTDITKFKKELKTFFFNEAFNVHI